MIDAFNETSIFTCGRNELDGIWGASVYYDILPYIRDIIKRMSNVSDGLILHEIPEKIIQVNPDDYDNFDDPVDLQTDESYVRGVGDRQRGIATLTTGQVYYPTPEPFAAASEEFINRNLALACVSIGIPESFLGLYKGEASAKVSGDTIERTQQMARLVGRRVQKCIIPKLRNATRLAYGRDDIEITWLDAITAFEGDTIEEREEMVDVADDTIPDDTN